MRWTPGGTSGDLEDRRNSPSGGGGFRGFGGGGLKLGLGGTLVVLVLSMIFKTDFFALLSPSGAPTQQTQQARQQQPGRQNPEEDRQVQFVSFVLDDTQRTWTQAFPKVGQQYRRAKLVLFRDYTQSGCGSAESATGPFYCPADEKVYVDLGFFDELRQKFAAPGEFAQAYVLAHEIGHHVQKLLGIEGKVRQMQSRNRSAANDLSVRLELQADCLAGIWGHSTEKRQLLEKGDIEAGLNAAAAVGDDRIQRMSSGHVSPERFTHGSSAQRMAWFKRGLASGDMNSCNSFAQQ